MQEEKVRSIVMGGELISSIPVEVTNLAIGERVMGSVESTTAAPTLVPAEVPLPPVAADEAVVAARAMFNAGRGRDVPEFQKPSTLEALFISIHDRVTRGTLSQKWVERQLHSILNGKDPLAVPNLTLWKKIVEGQHASGPDLRAALHALNCGLPHGLGVETFFKRIKCAQQPTPRALVLLSGRGLGQPEKKSESDDSSSEKKWQPDAIFQIAEERGLQLLSYEAAILGRLAFTEQKRDVWVVPATAPIIWRGRRCLFEYGNEPFRTGRRVVYPGRGEKKPKSGLTLSLQDYESVVGWSADTLWVFVDPEMSTEDSVSST